MKIVIVGASSGIGEALSYALAKDGHQLFLGGRDLQRLAMVAGKNAHYATVDVGTEWRVSEFFEAAGKQLGSIDALIVSAGTQEPIGPFYEKGSGPKWWRSVTTNLFGPFLCCQYALPWMGTGGRIILFAGGGAFNPRPHFSAYAVAKAGIVRLTETIAKELAPLGITCNAIAPGFVKETRIHEDIPKEHLNGDPVPMPLPVNCIRWMLTEPDGMTGRTISARFDPWDKPGFVQSLDKDLYTMQRVNPPRLDGPSNLR